MYHLEYEEKYEPSIPAKVLVLVYWACLALGLFNIWVHILSAAGGDVPGMYGFYAFGAVLAGVLNVLVGFMLLVYIDHLIQWIIWPHDWPDVFGAIGSAILCLPFTIDEIVQGHRAKHKEELAKLEQDPDYRAAMRELDGVPREISDDVSFYEDIRRRKALFERYIASIGGKSINDE